MYYRKFLASLLSILILTFSGFSIVSAQTGITGVTMSSGLLGWGGFGKSGFSGGEGGANSLLAYIMAGLAEIDAYFGDPSMKNEMMKTLVNYLNSKDAQQYYATDPVFANTLIAAGVIAQSPDGQYFTSENQLQNFKTTYQLSESQQKAISELQESIFIIGTPDAPQYDYNGSSPQTNLSKTNQNNISGAYSEPAIDTIKKIVGMGYSQDKAYMIAAELRQHPDWGIDSVGFYTDKNNDGVKERTSQDFLLQDANNALNGGLIPSNPSVKACDPLGPGGLNPDSPSGFTEGNGLINPQSGPAETMAGNPQCGGGGTPSTSAACTSYTYSEWSTCVDNNQTRSIKTKSPSGCSDSSSAVLTQSCVSPISPVIKNITSANQKSSRPLLSVTTNRAAFCQFNANGGFSYPDGTNFDTTGGYNHNAELPDMSNGQKVYYVVCKDNITGGMSEALKIEFTVNVDTAPVVTSVTPAMQTGANPALSVITDLPAACQYKKDAIFVFGAGTPIITNDNYNHIVSVAALADGVHSFYVLCKNNDTGAVSESKQIDTTLQRTAPANAPAVTNTTAVSQTANNPVLSVSTNIAAICQYQKDVQFAYGQGLPFSGDTAKTTHRAQLSGLAAGVHTYYVVCKNDMIDAQSQAMVIMFVVDAGQVDVCADLSANDRRNNANRSYWGNQNSDSVYLWQSVETGTRDKFDKVDWRAGYQFTPEKDGKVNQLCGNFAAGAVNRISLYDGSYVELAAAEITGNDTWRCADISPVEIKTDRRYYVIARIDNNPVYFEYKSGMLPKRTSNAVIEAGIRQSAGQQAFGYEIRKYDYMIFGLVDARVSWSPAVLTGPSFIASSPSGAVTGNVAVLSLIASGAAECRFGREDVSYNQMSYLMGKIATDNFTQKVCNLEPGDYTFYARCKNASGVENNTSAVIQFNARE